MNPKNETSYEEIQKILQPEIEALNHETVYAEYADTTVPALHYRSVVREKGMPSNSSAKPSPKLRADISLTEEHYLFLSDVRDFPGDGIKKRYDRLGIGPERGNRLLSELKKAGCIRVDEVSSHNPAGGHYRLVASLIPGGEAFLQAYEATDQQGRISSQKNKKNKN